MSPQDQYQTDFASSATRKGLALDRAWQTRNFEIELYWKRASYFWTMIGVLFAGYAVSMSKDGDETVSIILACVGLVLSLAWYLVNRASSAWQRNWEAHIDALEDDVTGPLYKVIYAPERPYRLDDWFGPLNMSPSKLTVAVSLFITLTWAFLVIYALPSGWNPLGAGFQVDIRVLVLAVTAASCSALLFKCQTDGGNYKLGFRRRCAEW